MPHITELRFINCDAAGLKMVLFAGSIEDFLQTTSSGGMHIIVEQQGIAPFPDAAGSNAGVGQLSAYSFKPVNNHTCFQCELKNCVLVPP